MTYAMEVGTWHKLYPQDLDKVKHELGKLATK